MPPGMHPLGIGVMALPKCLLGRLSVAQRVDTLDRKDLGVALTNAGWATSCAVDAKMAERVAREVSGRCHDLGTIRLLGGRMGTSVHDYFAARLPTNPRLSR